MLSGPTPRTRTWSWPVGTPTTSDAAAFPVIRLAKFDKPGPEPAWTRYVITGSSTGFQSSRTVNPVTVDPEIAGSDCHLSDADADVLHDNTRARAQDPGRRKRPSVGGRGVRAHTPAFPAHHLGHHQRPSVCPCSERRARLADASCRSIRRLQSQAKRPRGSDACTWRVPLVRLLLFESLVRPRLPAPRHETRRASAINATQQHSLRSAIPSPTQFVCSSKIFHFCWKPEVSLRAPLPADDASTHTRLTAEF